MRVHDKKSFVLASGFLLVLVVLFWTQSRFPALDDKALMGVRTHMSGLAFEEMWPLSSDDTQLERIAFSFANWAYTNWQGMSFGLLFAATFLCLLSTFSLSSMVGRNPWLGAVYGTFMGAPLGVCANCSTPVAYGMWRGGSPHSMAIATLSASPTLNIIVLSMSLALLPIELVIAKYLMVALYLLLFVPLLVKYLSVSSSFSSRSAGSGYCDLNEQASNGVNKLAESWMSASWIFLGQWLLNLWRVVRFTVPFMLLAGALGVLLLEFVPADAVPGLEFSLPALFLIAICASLFPVPIAFDVLICAALLSLGVDIGFVGALFFGLGVFSVYPAMMIARDLSKRLSLALLLAVVVLSVISGVLSKHWLESAQESRQLFISERLDAPSARSIMRKAARACHQFGEPEQYHCFENFVLDQLTAQFDVGVCGYLEDALDYRTRCEQGFAYQASYISALEAKDYNQCNGLRPDLAENCRFNVVFEMASAEQNLLLCGQLQGALVSQCQDEVLLMQSELFDSSGLCQTLSESSQIAKCEQTLIAHREMNLAVSQRDIAACEQLSEPERVQYCQGQVMVSLLEQGAPASLCKKIDHLFLYQRCIEFDSYFQALRSSKASVCKQIQSPDLRHQCRKESVAIALKNEVESLRTRYIRSHALSIDEPFNVDPDDWKKSLREEGENTPKLSQQSIDTEEPDLAVRSFLLNPSSAKAALPFTALAAKSIGLELSGSISAMDLFEPFSYGQGIAAADMNDDLWPDLAIAKGQSVDIYQNIGGRFSRVQSIVTKNQDTPFVVAYADLNSDNWPDLFVSYYGGNNRIYFNRRGYFEAEDSVSLTLDRVNVVLAAGFSDPDRDGDLDLVLGGWSFGDLKHFKPVFSRNYFLENLGNKNESDDKALMFRKEVLPGPDGETLSVLFSDLNRDGSKELVVGNDRDAPDLVYQWRDDSFELVSFPNAEFPGLSSFNTMSLDSGDINNDMKPDYLSVDMSFSRGADLSYCSQPGITDVESCLQIVEIQRGLQQGQVAGCESFDKELALQACLSAHALSLAVESGSDSLCALLEEKYPSAYQLCQRASRHVGPLSPMSLNGLLPSAQLNVLQRSRPEAKGFDSVATELGVAESMWSWNARIADLNNDGWQDIYIGNGYMFGEQGKGLHQNRFFENRMGETFVDKSISSGLGDYLNTPSFVLLDFDRDGDLDVITNRVAAEPGVFVNNAQKAGFSISLHDDHASTVGAEISANVSQAGAQLQQWREIKLSGGFLSFDPREAFFGVGEGAEISSIRVTWPDGHRSHIEHAFKVGYHYRILRSR